MCICDGSPVSLQPPKIVSVVSTTERPEREHPHLVLGIQAID